MIPKKQNILRKQIFSTSLKLIYSTFILTLLSLSNPISADEIINLSNYNYPKVSETDKDEFLLAILGTNDIHGQAYQRDFKAGDDNFKVGGYKLLSGVIRKIREEFKNQFLWLDAGDQFTGTVENIKTTGQIMVDFYNALKVDSVAIGNHEWDNKESQLRDWMAKELGRYANTENSFFGFDNANKAKNFNEKLRVVTLNNKDANENIENNHKNNNYDENNKDNLKENMFNLQQMQKANFTNSFLQTHSIALSSSTPKSFKFLSTQEPASEQLSIQSLTKQRSKNLYLAANLQLKDSFNKTSDDLPNRMSTNIFEFLNGKVKIGVIGLTTIQTNEKTAGFPDKKFNLLSYKPTVERLSKELKAKGATAVLIISHVGMTCKSPLFTPAEINEYYRLALRDSKSYDNSKILSTCRGEMLDLLQSLEPNTVQAVVAGHIHESIHHFINGIPVIQNPMSNIFTNVLYLKFKKDQNGNYFFNKDQSLIEGPIPLCSKIYTNNLRCNIYQDLTDNNIKLSEFSFHGSKLEVDPNVQGVFDKYKSLNEEIERMKLNSIFKLEMRLERSYTAENILGNLVADMYREMTNADIGMVSPGNMRYIWEKGQVSEYEFTNMFPFGGNFGRYNVTGANLKRIFQVLQDGLSGFYSFSGVNMTIIRYNETYAKLDMGTVKLWNGEVIQDSKIYSFASNEFELKGGDDMKNFIVNGTIAVNATAIDYSQPILSNFMVYLKKLSVLKEADVYKYLGRLNIVDIRDRKEYENSGSGIGSYIEDSAEIAKKNVEEGNFRIKNDENNYNSKDAFLVIKESVKMN
jgi:2',3'-cyclic-nucleotide 2'-phosphodiesterase (5'-nucleotidase family)